MNDSQKQSPGAVDFTALVEEARGGDQEAFTALYEASCQEVYRTIRAMVRSEELALDIQQDAYVYAFSRLDQLEDPAKFRSWLRSIAVNCTHTALRRQTPVLFTELEDDEGAGIPERADLRPEASPELSLERKEAAAYVREILDGLTPGQRMLVSMYYYEQLPVGRIAEDLGVSSGTVKTQLFRGRKKIEAAVKRLEAKGVKLFGLSPLPFLLALLKGLEPAAAAEKRVLNGALNRAGLAPAAEAVSVHVGRSFFQTALGRVVLGLIAAGAIGGGIAGYNWARDNILIGDVRTPTSVETAEDLTTEPVTRNDSEEDLFPEPSTAPTEIATEPTEIATVPTEPTEPTEITTEAAESPTEPDPTGPQPTQPTPTEPQPTQPTPTEPQPTQPANPTGPGASGSPDPTAPTPETTGPASSEANTEPATEEPSCETLPTENPYPDALGEIRLARSDDNVWSYSFPSDVEMEVSQFVFSTTNISGILVNSTYENGVQTIFVEPRTVGTCPIGIRMPGMYWYKLATIVVTSAEN